MPKYWGKQIFILGRVPEMGQKKKNGKERREVGNINEKLRFAMPPRVAHAKPPGPKSSINSLTKPASPAQPSLFDNFPYPHFISKTDH